MNRPPPTYDEMTRMSAFGLMRLAVWALWRMSLVGVLLFTEKVRLLLITGHWWTSDGFK
jgi:hypothetical protein